MTSSGARARLAAGIFVAAAVVASGAGAQGTAPARAQTLQKLTDCRKLTDGAARLACYDQAVGAMEQAEAKGDIVVVDREQARTVRRQAFGFTLPSISLFERGEKAEDLDNVAGKVAAFRMTSTGKWIIRLEDGATWAQVDSNDLARPPKAGMPVTIKRASMGSYMLSLGNQRAFRVNRTE